MLLESKKGNPYVVQPQQRAGDSKASKDLRSVDVDTSLARQGSNFGLPIALNLAMLMGGGIGIIEVLIG